MALASNCHTITDVITVLAIYLITQQFQVALWFVFLYPEFSTVLFLTHGLTSRVNGLGGGLCDLWSFLSIELLLNLKQWISSLNKTIPCCFVWVWKLVAQIEEGIWQLTACEQDQDQFHPDPARKLSANLYDIYHCCVYSEKLLMMDRGNVWNMHSFIPKNKIWEIRVSSWFYYKYLSGSMVTWRSNPTLPDSCVTNTQSVNVVSTKKLLLRTFSYKT